MTRASETCVKNADDKNILPQDLLRRANNGISRSFILISLQILDAFVWNK